MAAFGIFGLVVYGLWWFGGLMSGKLPPRALFYGSLAVIVLGLAVESGSPGFVIGGAVALTVMVWFANSLVE